MQAHKHKYHYLYKITNKINSKFYIGVHNTDDLNDGYMGSGIVLKKAMRKYGSSNFIKEYLMFFDTPEEAFEKEKELVNEELVKRNDCYNMRVGGTGIESLGLIRVYDEQGNEIVVSTDDPKYISKQYYPITKNWVNTRDKNNNIIRVKTSDPRYISGELVHNTKGYSVVRDEEGNIFQISTANPDYKSGKYKSINKDFVIVKDEEGNTKRISVTDPDYKSGKYKHINTGMYMMKDKDGNIIRVSENDERLKTGELVGLTKGYLTVKDKNGNKIKVKAGDERFASGELNGYRKNLVTVLDEDGNRITVRNDDPKFLDGTYRALFAGHRWVKKDGVSKHIKHEDVDYYLNNGWKLGRILKKNSTKNVNLQRHSHSFQGDS